MKKRTDSRWIGELASNRMKHAAKVKAVEMVECRSCKSKIRADRKRCGKCKTVQ